MSPPNLLVPVGTNDISFLCEINNSTQLNYKIYWIKNDDLIVVEDYSAFLIDPPVDESTNNNQSRLLIFNAGYDLDNTTFRCFIEYDGFHDRLLSNEVTLLVINGNINVIISSELICNNKINTSETYSPITPNPRIEHTSESPSLRLMWSPPYLWSGKYIDYFNISIIRKKDERILYTESVSVSDRLIDREIESITICQTLNYSEDLVIFEINAYRVKRDNHVMLLDGTVNANVTEGFPSGMTIQRKYKRL